MTDTPVPALVETEWLASRLDDPSVRIVDATWLMPNAGRKGIDDFNGGHIPGAVFWDIDAVADASSSLPHMMPDEATFERHMDALGISNDHHVVVYDSASMMTSPRVCRSFSTSSRCMTAEQAPDSISPCEIRAA